jgi:hypothetical protein
MSEKQTYVESRQFTVETWDGPSEQYPDLGDGKPVDSDGNYFVAIFNSATYIKKGWKILTAVDGKTKVVCSPEKFASDYCLSPDSQLQAQLAKAITALEPFSELYKGEYDNDRHRNDAYATVSVGDLRLASTTLAELRGGSSRSPAQAAGGGSPEIASTP